MVAYFGEIRAREARTETKRFRTFGEDVPPSRPQTRRRYIIQESWANHNLPDLPALCAGGCDAVDAMGVVRLLGKQQPDK
jgi:hypothetical protein